MWWLFTFVVVFVVIIINVIIIIIIMDGGQVVQEYERAVIFRLGRLRKGGAKVWKTSLMMMCFCEFSDPQGPGIFFVIPCIDAYKCVDLRTVSFDVPPQEVIE